jgi:hypothetical protein
MKRPLFAPFFSTLEEPQTRHLGIDAATAEDGKVVVGMI